MYHVVDFTHVPSVHVSVETNKKAAYELAQKYANQTQRVITVVSGTSEEFYPVVPEPYVVTDAVVAKDNNVVIDPNEVARQLADAKLEIAALKQQADAKRSDEGSGGV
jgi:hypothetical protein